MPADYVNVQKVTIDYEAKGMRRSITVYHSQPAFTEAPLVRLYIEGLESNNPELSFSEIGLIAAAIRMNGVQI